MKLHFAVFVATLAAVVAIPAVAHPGHTDLVDNHTHTLFDLIMMSAGPALLVLVILGLLVRWVTTRND